MHPDLSSIRKDLEELAREQAEKAGLLLLACELLGRGKNTIVRLYVDRQGGVTVDECSSLSRALGKELDDLDLIPLGYKLEVSSPGLGKPFRHRQQYTFALGQQIKVTLLEAKGGKGRFEGTLKSVDDTGIVLDLDGEDDLEIAFPEIKEASRVVVF